MKFPDECAARSPGRVAYVMADGGEVVTYLDLVERSRRCAHLLRELGVGPDDHIGVIAENHPRLLEVAWGAQRSGIRYTLMSPRSTAAECEYIVGDCDARLLITTERCSSVARAAAAARQIPMLQLDGRSLPGEDYAARSASEPATPVSDEVEGSDFLYSSGTTGRPKGIVLDVPLAPIGTPPGFAGLLAELWDFGEDTVFLSPAPLYHSAPLRFNMTVQRFGGTSVIMEQFDAERLLQLIEIHRVTHMKVVPTMFSRLLKLPASVRRSADLSSLRAVIHAAAPCPQAVKREMIEWLGPIVHEFYSATENYMFTHIDAADWLRRPGSVGRPIIGVPHVLDDDGSELPAGSVGQIWSEGGRRFRYHNDPEKTAASRNERGWTTVGDVGYLDRDGYLFLVDRRTDLILSGGVNVYPREAEDVLSTHPAVVDVAVFGVPDDDFGEAVKAVVQPGSMDEAGEELAAELLAHCREQLTSYKCPQSVDFRAELPRQATGKLYKRLLRDEYIAAARSAAPG
jgi:long-chain acyl-CoA synthetase